MVTVDDRATTEFVGLSTDTKPVDNVRNGSTFVEMDTQKFYVFDEENALWIEQT